MNEYTTMMIAMMSLLSINSVTNSMVHVPTAPYSGLDSFLKTDQKNSNCRHCSYNLKRLFADLCHKHQAGCWQPCTATAD